MDDETLRLIITILRMNGSNAAPREIELEYLRAGKLVAYRAHLAEHPGEDPRRLTN